MNTTLKDCVIPQGKSKVKAGEGMNKGAYRFFTSSPIQSKYLDEFQYESEALIFGTGGNASVHYCDEPFSTSTDCLVMYGKTGVNLKLIYYYLSGNIHLLQNGFKGAGLQHISKDYILSILIPFPSRAQQVEIVRTFDTINKLISKRQKQLEMLDALVKSRFIEMFGEYSEVAKLSDVANVSGGLTKNSKRNNLPLHMPYLRVANVAFASIDVTEMLDIGLTDDEFEKTALQKGDLLFVEGNGSPDQIGRVAIWKEEIKPCVHQNHLIKTRFIKNKIIPVFAMYYFMSQKGREQIKGQAVSTSGLYTLSVSKIENLLIPVPPLDLQHQFSAFVQEVDKSKLYDDLEVAA